MSPRRLAASALAVFAAACVEQRPPVAPLAPALESQTVAETSVSSATVQTTPTTPVSPSIAVSDELMQACMLDIDDVAKAPKFEFDKSELTAADYAVLTRIGRCLDAGALSGKRVMLIGRADPRGSDDYNLALGLRRAHRVALFFQDYGIEPWRIDEWTQGKREASGTDEASWQLDRRVDILIAE